jgi:hypothetical protein
LRTGQGDIERPDQAAILLLELRFLDGAAGHVRERNFLRLLPRDLSLACIRGRVAIASNGNAAESGKQDQTPP